MTVRTIPLAGIRDEALAHVAPAWSAVETVARLLRESPYSALRAIEVDVDREGVLTLAGRAPTYFLKQVAQTVACRGAGVDRIRNRIEVRRQPALLHVD